MQNGFWILVNLRLDDFTIPLVIVYTWFSSMTLAMAAMVAVLVYTVRRHRKDDYQGRYRVWLWAAACFMLMSLDETASLHEGFKEMMTLLTGSAIFGDGSIWWITCEPRG